MNIAEFEEHPLKKIEDNFGLPSFQPACKYTGLFVLSISVFISDVPFLPMSVKFVIKFILWVVGSVLTLSV